MGRYATPTEVISRYKRLLQVHSWSNIDSSFIPFAEAEVDARLSPVYSVPFSVNNWTAKDLTIDITLLKAGIDKGDDLDRIRSYVDDRIKDLIEGTMIMITQSGTAVTPDAVSEAYHNMQSYEPVFHMGDTIDYVVDEDLIEHELDRRDLRSNED